MWGDVGSYGGRCGEVVHEEEAERHVALLARVAVEAVAVLPEGLDDLAQPLVRELPVLELVPHA